MKHVYIYKLTSSGGMLNTANHYNMILFDEQKVTDETVI